MPEAGITHPKGCLCDGCAHARVQQGKGQVSDYDQLRPRVATGGGCPAQGGACFCTGACRGEAQEGSVPWPFDYIARTKFVYGDASQQDAHRIPPLQCVPEPWKSRDD